MSGLTEFLLARVAADEGVGTYVSVFPDGDLAPLFRRILAECDAKRRIVELHDYEWMGPDDAAGKGCGHDYEEWPCPTLRHLATVYANHPDYDEEWKP